MNKTFLVSLLTLLLGTFGLCLRSQAKIGETLEQCEARYGASQPGVTPDVRVFLHNGFRLNVTFFNGQADCIVFRKDGGKGKDSTAISKSDIDAFLAANGDGKAWLLNPRNNVSWSTDGGGARAFYRSAKPVLIIFSKAYGDRMDAKPEIGGQMDATE